MRPHKMNDCWISLTTSAYALTERTIGRSRLYLTAIISTRTHARTHGWIKREQENAKKYCRRFKNWESTISLSVICRLHVVSPLQVSLVLCRCTHGLTGGSKRCKHAKKKMPPSFRGPAEHYISQRCESPTRCESIPPVTSLARAHA